MTAFSTGALRFVVPPGLHVPTGGNVYARELAAACRRAGVEVSLERSLADVVPAASAAGAPGPGVVLVDGLVGSADPDGVIAARAAGHDVHILVHLPFAADPGRTAVERAREAGAFAAATTLVATSRWTADLLAERFGRLAPVVEPGTHPAPVARGSGTGPGAPAARLLSLGTLGPLKNQALLLEALALLGRDDVETVVAGPDGDRDYVRELRRLARRAPGPVRLPGPLAGEALEEVWDSTDLLVVTSQVETFGMVVLEAAARGIPAIVPAGTGAQATLRAGTAVAPRPEAVAEALAGWLGDAGIRARWAEQARLARPHLRTWDDTAGAVLDALAIPLPPAPPQDGRGAAHGPADADWLSLRRPADLAARRAAVDLVSRVETWLRGRPAVLVDVGSGTGSNQRWLAPRLPAAQHWALLDSDPRLVGQAVTVGPAERVTGFVHELPALLDRLLAAAPPGAGAVLTCSALLDVLTQDDVDTLVEVSARHAAASLLSLSVTGEVRLEPAHPDDAVIGAAFERHHRTRGRLGSEAWRSVADGLRRRGMRVHDVSTPWRLGASGAHHDLLVAYLTGRARAAGDADPSLEGRAQAWLAARLAQVDGGELRAVVGHVDILALP